MSRDEVDALQQVDALPDVAPGGDDVGEFCPALITVSANLLPLAGALALLWLLGHANFAFH